MKFYIKIIVRLKFQKRRALKFVSRTIPHSGGYNTPKLALGSIPVMVLFVFLTAGYAHSAGVTGGALSASSSGPVELASSSAHVPVQTAADAANPLEEEYKEDEVTANDAGKAVGEEKAEIADPLEPFNRAMHQFNDKLYFWALKPVAQGYKAVVPEPARISVKNFFPTWDFPPVSSVACCRPISAARPRKPDVLRSIPSGASGDCWILLPARSWICKCRIPIWADPGRLGHRAGLLYCLAGAGAFQSARLCQHCRRLFSVSRLVH